MGMAADVEVAAGVIGFPIAHSLSPVICQVAFDEMGLDYTYAAFEVPPGQANQALGEVRRQNMLGLSVTMPHKADAAMAVDELSPAAQMLGVVNCVSRQGTCLLGHNTDGAGFCDALEAEGVELAGRRCAVLGAGGAGRAVVAELARRQVVEVAVIARRAASAKSAAELAGAVGTTADLTAVGQYDLLVNATPVGMAETPDAGRLPLDPDLLHSAQHVAELVYNPLQTPLLAECAYREVPFSTGVGMLVHQAAHALRIWTGSEPNLVVMLTAAHAELARRHNDQASLRSAKS